MPDDLNQPLGLDQRKRIVPPQRGSARFVIAGSLVVLAAGAFALTRQPEPRAVARIEMPKPAMPVPANVSPPTDTTGTVAAPNAPRQTASAEEVERDTGVKVTRAGGAAAPGAMIIQLDEPVGVRLTPAPDKRLVERGKFGLLPRISLDGARPADIYARPVMLGRTLKAGAPRIAIMVGGLGLSQATTSDAIDALPPAVTLGFAPYGDSLESSAARAREKGHEIIAQFPMEPFDYPRNDPGPHTLRTDASPEDTMADMHWLMSRFTGYIGVANFLGAKFTAESASLSPVLREIASRGLVFLDDGASSRSQSLAAAAQADAPVMQADIVIDADPSREAMERALTKLETIARDKGIAIGTANALPQSIERVARFARGLEARGIALVPVSAAFARTSGAIARTPGQGSQPR